VLASFLFGTGYFNTSNLQNSSSKCNNKLYDKSPDKKLVFIILDGFRYDYLQIFENELSFLHKNNDSSNAWLFKTKSGMPTVTMPQIKSMVIGNHATYLDLWNNFGISGIAINQDSLIHQLKRAGKRIHFYGDDTWLKLYPDIFDESEGTHSFEVRDYTEVDNNVTRHIDKNLKHQPDVLILHYLGIDHIGHFKKPDTSIGRKTLKPKMQEMNEIMEKISQNTDDNTLILVTGDHGMHEQGIHGGSHYSERYTFTGFVFKEKVPQPHYHQINIIDIAPTTASLLGVPVPQKSLGEVHSKDKTTLIKSIEFLSCRIGKISKINLESKTVAELADIQREISDDIEQNSKTSVDFTATFGAIVLLVISIWFFILKNYGLRIQVAFLSMAKPSNLFLVIPGLLLFSSSYIEEEYLIWNYLVCLNLTWKLLESFRYEKKLSFGPELQMIVIWFVLSRWKYTGDIWKNEFCIQTFLADQFLISILLATGSVLFVFGKECLIHQALLFLYRSGIDFGVDVTTLQRMLAISMILHLISKKNWKKSKIVTFIVVMLVPLENVPVITLNFTLAKILKPTQTPFLTYAFMQCCYFQLGYCFSPTCIDFLPIYFGMGKLTEFTPSLQIIAGLIIIALSSYNMVCHLDVDNLTRKIHCFIKVSTLALYFSIVLLFRDHLSVWTVYCPKLFVEIATTISYILIH